MIAKMGMIAKMVLLLCTLTILATPGLAGAMSGGSGQPLLVLPHRPAPTTWKRTQCGHPNGTANLPTKYAARSASGESARGAVHGALIVCFLLRNNKKFYWSAHRVYVTFTFMLGGGRACTALSHAGNVSGDASARRSRRQRLTHAGADIHPHRAGRAARAPTDVAHVERSRFAVFSGCLRQRWSSWWLWRM